jgi:hypothetical protein
VNGLPFEGHAALRTAPCQVDCRHPTCLALCPQPARTARAERVAQWVLDTFGDVNARPMERILRFMEEAFELAQACGLTHPELTRLMLHVYGKPTGQIAQEIGGVGTTLLALSAAHGLDAEALEVQELRRVLTLDPAHFRARHNAKADAGVATRVPDPGPDDGLKK